MEKKKRNERRAKNEKPKPPKFSDVGSLVTDPNHPLSDLLYKKARHKVYWGGRGSAKSWGVCEALIRIASERAVRILCTREYQDSMKDSSHKLLKDTIERLGVNSWFEITNDSIKSKAGAEFIFSGLHGKDQTTRGKANIDIAWVEEAQTVTASSWQALSPTIRGDDSEIWVTYNLINEEDATHQRFVIKGRSDSIVHKINYDSNPFFNDVMRQEMEDDKAADFHLYEHIWLGMPRVISNAMILYEKYRIEEFDDELWRQATRVFYGADFGFATDPSTLIRFFMLEGEKDGRKIKKLYITHEAYGVGVEINEMREFYLSVPDSMNWPIKADSARPETISHMRGQGFNISAAKKWDGSLKDGITHLRGFDEIIIHPRCKQTAREANLWRYKVDKNVVDEKGQPAVLPIVIDAYNHCWDAVRYGLDGYIQRSGGLSVWERLGETE